MILNRVHLIEKGQIMENYHEETIIQEQELFEVTKSFYQKECKELGNTLVYFGRDIQKAQDENGEKYAIYCYGAEKRETAHLVKGADFYLVIN